MARPPASIVPLALAVVCAAVLPGIRAAETPYVMEKLGRGVVAVRSSETAVYVGWRLLATDDPGVRFNVYRSTDGQAPLKINRAPVAATTDFVDAGADLARANAYTVRPIVDGREQPASAAATLPANAAVQQFLTIPLQRPAGGTVEAPPGSPATSFTYSPNDASVGDLDGDGDYEIVVKWDPSNSRDTASPGVTGPVIFDAYELDGTHLWRIDLGRNIRAGAHYTQFIVYDLDGDGRAELACKTADGTVDGQRRTIGDASKDYRSLTVPTDGVQAQGHVGSTLRQDPRGPRVLHDLRRPHRRCARDDRLRAGPRPAGRMGRHRRQRRQRQQRQPRRSIPRGRRVSRRPPAERDHGARLLRPHGARRVGLA